MNREMMQKAEVKEEPVPGNRGLMKLILILIVVLSFMVLDVYFYRQSTMKGLGLRYLWLPVLALAWVFWMSLKFIQQAYSLSTISSALQYLLASAFSLNHPVVRISEGKVQVDALGKENLIEAIGGPGYLIIQPGNVVLLESLEGRWRVVGAGVKFMSAQERIKEAISLEERHAHIVELKATTRDGIPVIIGDIRFRFRPFSSDQNGSFRRSPDDPFPYSDEAIALMIYNRPITEEGLISWHQEVSKVVEEIILNFVRQSLVDHLTAPDAGSTDPRSEIYRRLLDREGKEQFRQKGAELLWVDIGHFGIPSEVKDQRVDNWHVRWSGSVQIRRAQDEAQRILQHEEDRAEAQAELLMNLLRRWEAISSKEEAQQSRHLMYLTILSQLLEMIDKSARGAGSA